MVKPAKTMQPESVDLTKAGRKSGRAFQDDSFHNYMARKIDLQRSQFGVLLPPPPTRGDYVSTNPSPCPKKCSSPSLGGSSRKRPLPGACCKSVSFGELPLVRDNSFNYKDDEEEVMSNNPHSISAIVKKLKQRHGRGSLRVLSKHRKQKVRSPISMVPSQQEEVSQIEENSESVGDSGVQLQCHYIDGEGVEDGNVDGSGYPSYNICSATATPSSTSKMRQERPDLFFFGVVVKVNGFTVPDNETIKRLIQRHGGDFETYETERVTHIVAEHMSTAKANALKQQRRPRPVVVPSWILESVKAGRLLPHGDYLLEELKDNHGRQPGIKDLFFSEGRRKIPLDPIKKVSNRIPSFTKSISDRPRILNNITLEQQSSMEVDTDDRPTVKKYSILPLTQAQDAYIDELSHAICENTPTRSMKEDSPVVNSLSLLNSRCDDKLVNLDDRSTLHPVTEGNASPETVHVDESDVKVFASPQKQTDKSQGRTDSKYINGKIRTVGTDPHFLESFFANSRLSFIGSYKQRTSNEETSAVSLHPRKVKSNDAFKRFVFHIDMDCFFANVVLRKYPQYRSKPVAISHHGKKTGDKQGGPFDETDALIVSDKSTSECATCNYHARKFGVKKGMFLGRARQLCPDLIVLQYDFAGYEEVSEQVLSILHRVAGEYDGCVEAVSCDEAYMELFVPIMDRTDPDNYVGEIAEDVRKEIFETTDCTASIGVAANKFLAKVGTDRVKPNGSFVVMDHCELLETLKLRDLHGIGYRSEPKLLAEGLTTVQDVWDLGSKAESILSSILGPGVGKKIYAFCYGRDDREVKPVERKTIGAECNYGVRFDGPYGIEHFMNGLASEVAKRMEGVACKGTKLTLKLKQRKKGAHPPPKFLGHGSCHSLSKSMDVPDSMPTRSARVLAEVGMSLFRELAVPLEDIRGMGIVVSKLYPDDGADPSESRPSASRGIENFFRNGTGEVIDAILPANSVNNEQKDRSTSVPELRNEGTISTIKNRDVIDFQGRGEQSPMRGSNRDEQVVPDRSSPGHLALPPFSQICMSQVAALPPELQEEIHSRFADHSKKNLPGESLMLIDKDSPSTSGLDQNLDDINQYPLPTAVPAHERIGFRQTSLKRMMKLAAVKSGKGIDGLSLIELQRLPLEIQLQIVNEDSNPVGLLSQKPRNSLVGHSTKSRLTNVHVQGKGPSIQHKQTPKGAIEIDLTDDAGRQRATTDKWEQFEMEEEVSHADLFDDDILPLQLFLDQNSPLNSEAVEMVIEFLRTCIKERRMNALCPLLRSIKNRTDRWSDRIVLLDIVHGVDEHHNTMYNSRLDIDWLLRD